MFVLLEQTSNRYEPTSCMMLVRYLLTDLMTSGLRGSASVTRSRADVTSSGSVDEAQSVRARPRAGRRRLRSSLLLMPSSLSSTCDKPFIIKFGTDEPPTNWSVGVKICSPLRLLDIDTGVEDRGIDVVSVVRWAELVVADSIEAAFRFLLSDSAGS